MKVLQVKQYNQEIAHTKYQNALARYRERNNGFPCKSMFYFTLHDRQGYPTGHRQKGYIAFDDRKACFGINEKEAVKHFNNNKRG